MIPVLQILLVLLAIATIVRAPRRLPHWLAAAAALQVAFVLQFNLEFAAVLVIFGLGCDVLVLLIHADLTLQYGSGSTLPRLIAPVLPAIVLVRLYYAYLTGILIFYVVGYEIITPADALPPIMMCVALLAVIIAVVNIASRHPLRSFDRRLGYGVALFGIVLAAFGVLERVLGMVVPMYLFITSIASFSEAEHGALRRWAIAANGAWFCLISIHPLTQLFLTELLFYENNLVVDHLVAVFGAAVGLTCVSLIYHPAAAPSQPRTDPSGGTAHPIGLAG